MTQVKRLATGPFAWKVCPLGLVWIGFPEKAVGIVAFVLMLVLVTLTVRRGIAEQRWEPAAQQYARQWENRVWDNTRWDNGTETPHEAIDRLAGPHRRNS